MGFYNCYNWGLHMGKGYTSIGVKRETKRELWRRMKKGETYDKAIRRLLREALS